MNKVEVEVEVSFKLTFGLHRDRMQTEHLSENALNFFVLRLCSVIFNIVNTRKSLISVEKFFQSTINRNREIPQYA